MSEQHYWCRVECDARLVSRKLARRKRMGYAVSGHGEAYCAESDGYFPVIVLVAQIIAPSRELALSHLIRDCPGGVITFCQPTDPVPPSGRFEGLLPFQASAPLASPELLARAEQQMAQIEAHSTAHKRQMRINERNGRTDDAAFAQIDQEHPWPRPLPAYRIP